MRTIRVHEDDKPFWLELLEYFFGLVAIIGAIYFGSLVAQRVIVDKMPEQFENVMVKVIDRDSFNTPFFYFKTEMMMQELADGLKASLPNPPNVTIRIIENEIPSLVCLPGGYVVFSSGLLRQLTSENELTFLVANAIGHVYHRHHLVALNRAAVWVYLVGSIFGAESGVTKTVANYFSFTHPKLSVKQEIEADQTALRLYKIKYDHAGGLVELLERLNSHLANRAPQAFLSEHPATFERIDALTKEMFPSGTPKPPVPLSSAFLNKNSF